MAKLTTEQKDALYAEIMREWSATRTPTPITKSQGRALIDLMDNGLESAEASIVSGIPSGAAKTWLVGNTSIAREVLKRVAQARKEQL